MINLSTKISCLSPNTQETIYHSWANWAPFQPWGAVHRDVETGNLFPQAVILVTGFRTCRSLGMGRDHQKRVGITGSGSESLGAGQGAGQVDAASRNSLISVPIARLLPPALLSYPVMVNQKDWPIGSGHLWGVRRSSVQKTTFTLMPY